MYQYPIIRQGDGSVIFSNVETEKAPGLIESSKWVGMAEESEGGNLDEYHPIKEGILSLLCYIALLTLFINLRS
jgi:hypothetical protein